VGVDACSRGATPTRATASTAPPLLALPCRCTGLFVMCPNSPDTTPRYPKPPLARHRCLDRGRNPCPLFVSKRPSERVLDSALSQPALSALAVGADVCAASWEPSRGVYRHSALLGSRHADQLTLRGLVPTYNAASQGLVPFAALHGARPFLAFPAGLGPSATGAGRAATPGATTTLAATSGAATAPQVLYVLGEPNGPRRR